MAEPPLKKSKIAYDQTWKEDYAREFKGIIKSDKGISMAFCQTCNSHFSIKASGKYDVKRHFATQKHIAAQKAAGTSNLLSSFSRKEDDHSMINAEVIFTKFIIEKDLPIAIADDVGDLLRKMFPKVSELKNYKCARTKTTAIIHTLAEHEKKQTVDNLLSSAVYSLSTDGGNDTKQKLFPIIVRYADLNNEKIVTEILSVDTLSSTTATGLDIYTHVKQVVDDHGLNLTNCISFSVDNAAVMVGETSGVAAHLHTVNENINIIGCPCHRLNLAALKAANSLPHKIDQLLIDIYFFLDKSSKRVGRLKELQEILGCQSHEILKHVNTRWLSLGPCTSRLLEQWEPLSALFLEISEDISSRSTQQKSQGVLKKLLSDELKAYVLFIENVIPVFENALLQKEEPLIQKLRSIFQSVIRDLSLRFMMASAVGDSDAFQLDVKKNLLPDSEIDVGFKCRKFVEKELKEEERSKFFKSVVKYLQVAIEYLQSKCNMDNQAIINASVADPLQKKTSSFASLQYFVDRFNDMLRLPIEKEWDEKMDVLNREFRQWQASDLSLMQNESADSYWFRMGKEETQEGGKRFSLLSKCMLGVLSMFHSNASCERLFSFVRRNRTDFRHSMSNRLVESLAICKNKSSSFRECIPKEVLVKAKSATYKPK